MASQFTILWGELKNLTPMTQARDFNYERDRKDIMNQLGMLGPITKKKGGVQVKLNKHHGKKARAMENGCHQDALHQDNKVAAAKRLAVQSLVHEVASKQKISLELAKYVKAQEPIPPRLLKELTGASMTKKGGGGKLPPLDGTTGKKYDGYIPPPTDKNHKFRSVTTLHKQCDNKWPLDERTYLAQLYREFEKPEGSVVSLWKIYYDRLAERFRGLYPHRAAPAIIAKLHEMIAKRQFHDEKEVAHWSSMQGNKISHALSLATAALNSPIRGLGSQAESTIGALTALSTLSPLKSGIGGGGSLATATMSAVSAPASLVRGPGASNSVVNTGAGAGTGAASTSGNSRSGSKSSKRGAGNVIGKHSASTAGAVSAYGGGENERTRVSESAGSRKKS